MDDVATQPESFDLLYSMNQYRKLAEADINRHRSLAKKLLTNLRLLNFDFDTTAALFSTSLDETIFEQPHIRLLEEILYYFMSLIDRAQCEQVLCGYWPPQSAEQHKYFRDTSLEFLAPVQARNASIFPPELLSKRLLDAACGVGILWLLLATSTHILCEICKEEFAVSSEELRSLYQPPDEHVYLREQRKQMLCERVNEWHAELLRLIKREAVEMQQVTQVAEILEQQYWEQEATVDVLKAQITVFANSLYDQDSIHDRCAPARAAHARQEQKKLQHNLSESSSVVDLQRSAGSLGQPPANKNKLSRASADNVTNPNCSESTENRNESGRKLQFALFNGLSDVLTGTATAEDAIKLDPAKWSVLETKFESICESIADCTNKIEQLKVDSKRIIPQLPAREEFAQQAAKPAHTSVSALNVNYNNEAKATAIREQRKLPSKTFDLADFVKQANERIEMLIAVNLPVPRDSILRATTDDKNSPVSL